MKKFFSLLILVSLITVNASSQSLFKKIYADATAVVNNPQSSEEQIQINQFKVTALNYIKNQIDKKKLKKDEYFYDSQAVNLASFITDYQINLIKARSISAAKKTELMNCYKNATLASPLFNDADKATSHVYINDNSSLTPFSLDTDWDKAYTAATKQVKTIVK